MAMEIYQVDVPEVNRQTLREISKKTKEFIKAGYDNFKEVEKTEVKDAKDNEVTGLVQETLLYIKTDPEARKEYKKLLDLVTKDLNYKAPTGKDAAILYTIDFRLKQLGFNESTQKNTDRDFLYNLMNFQFKAKEKKIDDPNVSNIEGVCGPRTLRSLIEGSVDATTPMTQEKLAVTNKAIQELSKLSSELQTNGTTNVSSENTHDQTKEQQKDVKQFEEFVALSNTEGNITSDELANLNKLERKVNNGEKMYVKFQDAIIKKIEKTYADRNVKTFEGNIAENVKNILKDFSEGYLDETPSELKELELDPNFFYAIKGTIIDMLSAQYIPTGDEKKDIKNQKKLNQQKRRLIYFVRSFTGNFNSELAKHEKTLSPLEF